MRTFFNFESTSQFKLGAVQVFISNMFLMVIIRTSKAKKNEGRNDEN